MNKLLFLVLFISFSLSAQNPAKTYADQITESDLRENLTIIASDAMEGRETGKRGQKMAAAFIAAYFHDLGLKAPVNGSHYQPVPLLMMTTPVTATLKSGQTEFLSPEFAYYDGADSKGAVTLPLVYGGTGTDAELKGIDIKDKALLISLPATNALRGSLLIDALKKKGVKLVLVAVESDQDYKRAIARASRSGRLLLNPKAIAPTMVVTPDVAGKIFKMTYEELCKANADAKAKSVKQSEITYSVTNQYNEVDSENILGFLEGTDKKDEVVVITAHYDHIGISPNAQGDKINNGADDDGSGTVGVLQLAKVFAQAKKDGKGPRRSILFMTVTGEEKGLLGSEYYSNQPIFPLDKTIVDLNIDMVGRRDPEHPTQSYVYLVGSDRLSTELHTLSENVNKANLNLDFDYLYNAEDHPERIYYRSDHWNFAKKNIPIIFYTDGLHADYHRPSDEVDKIEFDLLSKRIQTVFYTAWEIANRENRIMADKKQVVSIDNKK
jgi:hypothetical protein